MFSYSVIPTDDTYDLIDEYDTENNSNEDEDEEDVIDLMGLKTNTTQPLWVLPLYSILSSREQAKVNMQCRPYLILFKLIFSAIVIQ